MKIYGLKLTKRGSFTLLIYFLLMFIFIEYLIAHKNDTFIIIAAIIGAIAFPVAVLDSIFDA